MFESDIYVLKKRGFEVAKGWEDKNINLPVRKTKYSAGYDVEAAEDTIIPVFKNGDKPTLIHTGLSLLSRRRMVYVSKSFF